jgi:adenine-specific DNA-methyltransferase
METATTSNRNETHPFDFPKPLELVKLLVEQGSADNDIFLDFFAGSCPAAQAVLELNREDGNNRCSLMMQLPEPTAENSPAREGCRSSRI